MERNAEKVEKLNDLSGEILDASIEVHRHLGGTGLLEDIYEESLARELMLRGFDVQRQVQIPVYYKDEMIRQPLVLDLLVNDVIIEIKSVEKFNQVFLSQLLTYLRLSNRPFGIVVNFGEKFVKDGFFRVVNNFPG
mgnify:CR=1 FL=1